MQGTPGRGGPWQRGRALKQGSLVMWAHRLGSGWLRGPDKQRLGWEAWSSLPLSMGLSCPPEPNHCPALSPHQYPCICLPPWSPEAETCPGLATAPAGPSGRDGSREKTFCCKRGTSGTP